MRTRLHGIHHVAAITADAQPNVDEHSGVLSEIATAAPGFLIDEPTLRSPRDVASHA